MTRTVINKVAGYRIEIDPSLSEEFAGYEARLYNLIGDEYVDTFSFRTLDEAIEFAENEEMDLA